MRYLFFALFLLVVTFLVLKIPACDHFNRITARIIIDDESISLGETFPLKLRIVSSSTEKMRWYEDLSNLKLNINVDNLTKYSKLDPEGRPNYRNAKIISYVVTPLKPFEKTLNASTTINGNSITIAIEEIDAKYNFNIN
ncbi:hypothetical protein [Portibacter marinus]|uniref:hypothetical protein n=1 Tax=Portibacter marinus TaxID=2898660 RepID=UPI001F27BD35|nr:hypothetical protein [Portibacter marinus]